MADVSLQDLLERGQGLLGLPLLLTTVQKLTRGGQEGCFGVVEEGYRPLSRPVVVLQGLLSMGQVLLFDIGGQTLHHVENSIHKVNVKSADVLGKV